MHIRLNNLVPNGHMLPAVEKNGPQFLLNGWLKPLKRTALPFERMALPFERIALSFERIVIYF